MQEEGGKKNAVSASKSFPGSSNPPPHTHTNTAMPRSNHSTCAGDTWFPPEVMEMEMGQC